jgi:hypothetical protein
MSLLVPQAVQNQSGFQPLLPSAIHAPGLNAQYLRYFFGTTESHLSRNFRFLFTIDLDSPRSAALQKFLAIDLMHSRPTTPLERNTGCRG